MTSAEPVAIATTMTPEQALLRYRQALEFQDRGAIGQARAAFLDVAEHGGGDHRVADRALLCLATIAVDEDEALRWIERLLAQSTDSSLLSLAMAHAVERLSPVDPRAARVWRMRLLDEHPHSAQAAAAALELLDTALAAGDAPGAARLLGWLEQHAPASTELARARHVLGRQER
jgi:hypothetical protein